MMEVVHATGASARQIDHWVTKGYIPSSGVMANPGSGMRRDWTLDQVTFVRMMSDLVKFGMKPDRAAEAVQALLADGEVRVGSQIKVALR